MRSPGVPISMPPENCAVVPGTNPFSLGPHPARYHRLMLRWIGIVRHRLRLILQDLGDYAECQDATDASVAHEALVFRRRVLDYASPWVSWGAF